jgi:hypothetical protein
MREAIYFHGKGWVGVTLLRIILISNKEVILDNILSFNVFYYSLIRIKMFHCLKKNSINTHLFLNRFCSLVLCFKARLKIILPKNTWLNISDYFCKIQKLIKMCWSLFYWAQFLVCNDAVWYWIDSEYFCFFLSYTYLW